MSLSPDTQAILLLTVPLTNAPRKTVRPLSPGEWGRFAVWLKERRMKPAMLLSGDLDSLLEGWSDDKITAERLQRLLDRGTALALATEKWSRAGLWIMTRSDPDYPARLKQRLKMLSPPVLFGCGDRKLLRTRALAVAGSRQAAEADLDFSRNLGKRAAEQGHTIVSGGARGVDEAAMLGALESAGTVIGVLSSGLLKAGSSRKYRNHLMANELTLISPFNPEAGFHVGNAMQRNKYIYCLADAAVVVHAGKTGGTWNGAMENLRNRWVPLWVKRSDDPAAGNGDLVAAGGRWLPDVSNADLDVLFSPAETDRVLPEAPPQSRGDPVGMEFYELFLLKIQSLCATTPKTKAELAESLRLKPGQLETWLKQAEQEGKLEKFSRPVRYRWCTVRQESMPL